MAKKHKTKPEMEFVTEEVIETPVEEAAEKEISEESKVQEKKEAKKFATVKDVDILNIRENPNGNVVFQIGKNVPMQIISDVSITDNNGVEWYEVATPIGVKGFAMSKYLFIYEEGPFEEV